MILAGEDLFLPPWWRSQSDRENPTTTRPLSTKLAGCVPQAGRPPVAASGRTPDLSCLVDSYSDLLSSSVVTLSLSNPGSLSV